MFKKLLIEVFSTQMRVTVGGLDFKHTARNLKDRHIKRTATEIIHCDHFSISRVHTVCERCCRGLVDDTHDIQPGNPPSILRRLSLGVVEVSRHRDHCARHRGSQELLCSLLHFRQHKRPDL
mmetsp:Transcript_6168/g.13167  ORF Transcript_6168/g.13167 Transcript_6168/m.13167 type:complete len:122 (-) Transcript_6168:76-441(-)